MTKYEIRTHKVEMNKSDYANYSTVYEKFNYSTNQTPDSTYEFDIEEEAQKDFDKMSASFLPNYGGCGVSYDLCEVLILARIKYDDDGEFVAEEYVDIKYEDRTTRVIDEESEDEDEE